MKLKRRTVLIGAAAGGGLLAWYALQPRSFTLPLGPDGNERAFNAWIKIALDGIVTIAVPQLEMGQGVTSLLPQIAAMELGADWRQIAVEPAPTSGAYANSVLAARWASLWMPAAAGLADEPDSLLAERFAESERFSATADGTTLAAYELPVREAAASVRAVLCMAAADRWDVAWEECRAGDGFITHEDRRLSFGALAAAAADYSPPSPPPLFTTPPGETQEGGEQGDELSDPITFPRLDLPAKVDGSFQFATDLRLPGMVYAAIKHGPLNEATLTGFDADAIAGMAGLVGIVEGKRWIAAVAETSFLAERAVEALAPRFSVSRQVGSAAMARRLRAAQREGRGQRVVTLGEGDEAMPSPADLALRYEFAPQLHGQLEPTSATAWLREGRLELWMASQAPEQARRAAAKAAGISLGNTVLYPMPAGGSFDRRLEHAQAIEVAVIAREIGRPVQLTWSRFQEHLAGYPRSPASVLVAASHSESGDLAALRVRAAMPATTHEFGRRLFDNKTSWAAIDAVAEQDDALVGEGMVPPYRLSGVAVDHVPLRLPLPTARLRGNAHAIGCFALECFVDEVARRHGREPLSYRMQMLGDDVRLANCLQRSAQLAGWDGGASGTAQGLACWRIGEGRIAAIATARPGEGGLVVDRIAATVDIGRIINRDLARQQIEGGLIFGLGLATGSATGYIKGLPTAQRLAALGLPRLADSPEISVILVDSAAEPADPGELGAVVAPPAIANALFAATGARIRELPLISPGE